MISPATGTVIGVAENVLEQHYESVDIDSLTPHPENPRRNDVDVIVRSIQATGFFGALVVHRPTRHILVGNHRWLAARRSGLTHLPVLFVDCDERQAKRILLADNRIAELAQWDEAKLLALLNDLEATGTQLDTLGFSEADLAAIAAGQVPPRSKDDDEDWDERSLWPVLSIRAPAGVIESFRAMPGADDLDRLLTLMKVVHAAQAAV